MIRLKRKHFQLLIEMSAEADGWEKHEFCLDERL